MLLLHFYNAKVFVFFFTFLLLHFYEHLKFRTIAMNKIKSNINPFVKSGALPYVTARYTKSNKENLYPSPNLFQPIHYNFKDSSISNGSSIVF